MPDTEQAIKKCLLNKMTQEHIKIKNMSKNLQICEEVKATL